MVWRFRRLVVVRERGRWGINVALRDVNISKEGKVIVAGREEVGRTEAELGECMFSGFVCVVFLRAVLLCRGRGRRGG